MARPKNPNGGKSSDKLMGNALVIALKQAAVDANGQPTKRLNLVAERLVLNAMAGDTASIKEIFDRVDGRVPQKLPEGANGRPARIFIGWLTDDDDQPQQPEPLLINGNGEEP